MNMGYLKKLPGLLIKSLLIFFIASLLHFGYSATRFFPLSFISAVNESVWEHIKIIFFAALFYSLFSYFKKYRGNSCFVAGLAPSLFSIIVSVPLMFYGYTSIFGHDIFVFDLIITYLSALLFSIILDHFARSARDCSKYKTLSVLFTAFLILLFFLFTWYPPDFQLFIPPK